MAAGPLQQQRPPSCGALSGIVTDISGAPVAGARVTLREGPASRDEITSNDGRFSFDEVACAAVVVTGAAAGLEPSSLPFTLTPESPGAAVRFVLRPAPLAEAVTVTAARGRSPVLDPSASLTVLSSADLTTSAAAVIDDRLREVPGFSLFRRSSSRTANPTTQGVTLRGLSASGASRTIVLLDGVPLNDPFGGWIAWNRLPPLAIDRIEVLRGPAGDLYGASALGGVIQVLTFDAGRPRLRTSVEGGGAATWRVSMYGGGARGAWQGFASADGGGSDGFYVAAPEIRGPVDTRAAAEHRSVLGGVGLRTARSLRLDGRAGAFDEARRNGTPLQVNDTNLREASVAAGGAAGGGWWTARLYGLTERYDQSFSSVTASRTREDLTRVQRVPSESVGATAEWFRQVRAWRVLAGAEARRVSAQSNETQVVAGTFRDVAPVGGREDRASVFGQVSSTVAGAVTVTGGARVERWRSESLDSSSAATDRVDLSPRAAVVWTARPNVTLRGSAHTAFRAPTLNERYRSFRVGDTTTLANERLEPERLAGAEAAITLTHRRFTVRTTAFAGRLEDAITNVTLTSSPALIVRERRNAGSIRADGIELEAEWRPTRAVDIAASWIATRSKFSQAVEPDLVGRRVPQVPGRQASLRGRLVDRWGGVLSASVRYVSAQFDDDRNQFELRPYALADLFFARALPHGLQVFAAVENLADVDYDVARTPQRSVGVPRTFRAGIRWFVP